MSDLEEGGYDLVNLPEQAEHQGPKRQTNPCSHCLVYGRLNRIPTRKKS